MQVDSCSPAQPQGVTGRATAQDGHAGGDERHSLPAAHRLSVALSAARRLSAPLDGLQHLPQVPARGNLGGDLGRVAASRSWIAAEWTITRIGSPSVSTRAWILRPFTFLPAS